MRTRPPTSFLALFLLLLPTAGLAAPPLDEAILKAVFLERFTRFIEWPEKALPSSSTLPFIIGVTGPPPFDQVLETIYGKRTIKGRDVIIRRVQSKKNTDWNKLESCHLLFITGLSGPDLSSLLKELEGKPILTIGDAPDFALRGGHIHLYIQDGAIKFDVNAKTSRESKLKMSHLLLKHAQLVKGRDQMKENNP